MNSYATLITLGLFALVLIAQCRLGARWAGLFAALPVTTMSTAVAAHLSFGATTVQNVLLGAMIAIGGSALATQVYARCAKAHPAVAWLAAMLSFFVITLGIFYLKHLPALCAALSLALVVVCMALKPAARSEPARKNDPSALSRWYPRVVGAAWIAGCSELLAVMPGATVGVFAGAPIMGLGAFVVSHLSDRAGTHLRLQASGYCEGMLLKWAVIAGVYFALSYAMPMAAAVVIGFCNAVVVWMFARLMFRVNPFQISHQNTQICAAGITRTAL
jgi:uncharacterized membrane protein YfcA